MTKRISVIIPVYNSESYLEECLNSVYKELSSLDEVVIINDHSNDNSLKIVEETSKKHPHIKTIVKSNPESKGPAFCRNLGVAISNGDYILFIDSDDILAERSVNILYNHIKEKDWDLVQGQFAYKYPDFLLVRKNKYLPNNALTLDRGEAMKCLVNQKLIYNFLWAKMFKRELLVKYPLREEILMGEDAFNMHYFIDESSCIGVIKDVVYYYRQNPASLSYTFSDKNLGLLKAHEDRYLLIKKNYPKLSSLQRKILIHSALEIYNSSLKSSFEVREKTGKYIKKLYERINLKKNGKDKVYKLLLNNQNILSTYFFIKRIQSFISRKFGASEYERI